jgi:hypothetical protein
MHIEGKGKVIGVIGTRSRDGSADFQRVREEFFFVYEPGDWLCSGDCQEGGDRFALKIARREGIPILSFPPGTKDSGVGKFFARNDLIAFHSTILIACVFLPFNVSEKGGTNYTIRKFKELHPESWERNLIIV